MGLCGGKDWQFRQPAMAKVIVRSDISDKVRCQSKPYSDIQKFYTFKRVLGHGHFGTVREAWRISDSTKKLFAVKSIPKEKIKKDLKLMKRELEVLHIVDHPNIIEFFETFEDERYVHIVMEECTGGDLFDHLITHGQYTEQEAAILLRKIITAINHLHHLHICHRDIKPENFLFQSPEKLSEVKIIDFGLATKFGEEQMHTVVGTPYYVAPEVLQGNYGKECDVWSLGVLLYVMLAGYPPFYGDSQHEIFKRIIRGMYDFDREEWSDVSAEARDLISSMLVVNPAKRATLDKVLRHEWFSIFETQVRPQVPLRILERLKYHHCTRKLRREVLKVVVKLLSNEQVDELRQAFESIDTQSTGFISVEELQQAMTTAGLTVASDEIASKPQVEIVSEADYLHQGKLNYTEFVIATLDRKKVVTEEVLYNAFKQFDTENQGFITPESLALVFQHAGYEADPIEYATMIKEYDLSSEQIDFDSFRHILSEH